MACRGLPWNKCARASFGTQPGRCPRQRRVVFDPQNIVLDHGALDLFQEMLKCRLLGSARVLSQFRDEGLSLWSNGLELAGKLSTFTDHETLGALGYATCSTRPETIAVRLAAMKAGVVAEKPLCVARFALLS